MASQTHGVSIKVHPSFFDNIFEKKRRKVQRRLHISNLSQMKFTEYLAKNNAEFKLKIPKKMKSKNPVKGRRFYGQN